MPQRAIHLAWNADYEIREARKPEGLTILLHGYQQNGRILLASLRNCISENHVLLAPNAPFPVPLRTAAGNQLGYTWYFYDPETDVYFYDMSFAVAFLKALVEDLGLNHLPKTLVGYSQGGYLAPFLGLELERVRRVVGINCRFRSETLRPPLSFRLDGVHGARDQLVDPERAHRCHQELKAMGQAGSFTLIPECGHGISGPVRETLKSLLANDGGSD